ncbi:MAG: hypothetical protein HRT57_15855, partial [Crocinitomicaceae bacterium]|nr:hypothetical protein [Crocinitomicaceae bacterium]
MGELQIERISRFTLPSVADLKRGKINKSNFTKAISVVFDGSNSSDRDVRDAEDLLLNVMYLGTDTDKTKILTKIVQLSKKWHNKTNVIRLLALLMCDKKAVDLLTTHKFRNTTLNGYIQDNYQNIPFIKILNSELERHQEKVPIKADPLFLPIERIDPEVLIENASEKGEEIDITQSRLSTPPKSDWKQRFLQTNIVLGIISFFSSKQANKIRNNITDITYQRNSSGEKRGNQGTISFGDESKYVGSFSKLNLTPDGEGKMIYKQGLISLSGIWEGNRPDGLATLIFDSNLIITLNFDQSSFKIMGIATSDYEETKHSFLTIAAKDDSPYDSLINLLDIQRKNYYSSDAYHILKHLIGSSPLSD